VINAADSMNNTSQLTENIQAFKYNRSLRPQRTLRESKKPFSRAPSMTKTLFSNSAWTLGSSITGNSLLRKFVSYVFKNVSYTIYFHLVFKPDFFRKLTDSGWCSGYGDSNPKISFFDISE